MCEKTTGEKIAELVAELQQIKERLDKSEKVQMEILAIVKKLDRDFDKIRNMKVVVG